MPADTVGRGRTRISDAALQVALNSLLERHPDAWVVAIKPSGHFTSMPEAVPLRGQRVIQGPASALELVVPADRPVVIDTWARAVTEGGGNAPVHAYGDPSRVITMHFMDLTHKYGVYIGVFVGYGSDSRPAAAEQQVLAPRTSVLRKDEIGVIMSVDDAATAILGWRADELVGHRSLDFLHPDDQDRAVANWMEMFARPGSSQRIRVRHRHKDGTWVWLEITNHNRLADPEERCVLADNVDVTDEVTAIEALQANERVLRRLTEALPVGVVYVAADRTVDYGNERLAAIVGTSWANTVEEQFASAVGQDRESLLNAVSAVLERGNDVDMSVSFLPKPDTTVRCDVTLRALINEAGEVVGAIACVADVTEDLRLREELRERARYDLLTGCLNHASVMSELSDRLAATAGDGLTVALFIDLDEFKAINDHYGHAAGDQVLRQVADDLRTVTHDDDLLGRLGGDEFLVVRHSEDDPRALTGIADQVTTALDHDVQWEGDWISPGASIGLSYARAGSGISAEKLVRAADAAMYVSKRGGGVPVFNDATSRASRWPRPARLRNHPM
jgi:diguanylate cyclase (GGDEF)-like protein/PAS domain S-box-containing protein